MLSDSYFGGVQPQGHFQTTSKTYIFLGFTNSGFLKEAPALELDIFLWNGHRLHVDSSGMHTRTVMFIMQVIRFLMSGNVKGLSWTCLYTHLATISRGTMHIK